MITPMIKDQNKSNIIIIKDQHGSPQLRSMVITYYGSHLIMIKDLYESHLIMTATDHT